MADDTRFRLLGEEESRRILRSPVRSAEMWGLRMRAGRRLMPVTTEEERAAARVYAEAHPRPKKEERRLARLRERANQLAHRCAGFGCPLMVPGDQLMCFEHWVLVAEWLREQLVEARTPTADLQWPIELVEQAIRFTLTDGDVEQLVTRIETSAQEELLLEELAS